MKKKIEQDQRTSHPSFGMLSFSRVSATPPVTLFGSPHAHSHYITLTLSEAEQSRLADDWRFATTQVFTVAMSAAQFGELVAGFNVGSGVPVTIQCMQGKSIPPCPETSLRGRIMEEFKATCQEVTTACEKLSDDIGEKLKGNLKVADKKALASEISTLVAQLRNTMPFIQSRFNEALDKSTASAKADVYRYFEECVRAYGLEALQTRLQQVLDNTLQIEDVSD